MKTCSRCKADKPLTEFHKCLSKKFGVQSFCRACTAAYQKTRPPRTDGASYFQLNKERIKAYRAAHRDRENELARARYAKDPSKRMTPAYFSTERRQKAREAARQYSKKICVGLSDGYLRALLAKKTRLNPSDIPMSMVEAKRIQMMINRELKNENRQ